MNVSSRRIFGTRIAGGIALAAVLIAAMASILSCGEYHEPYRPDRPFLDAGGKAMAPAPPAGWLPPTDLLEVAAAHPPAALARLDRFFERVARSAQQGPGWTDAELAVRIDSIRAAMDLLGLAGRDVLQQRMGSLDAEREVLFRRAAALEMRWGLALMQTGEIDDRVTGAIHLRQALDWDPGNPVLILLLAGYYDLAGFVSNGTSLLRDFLHDRGHHDLIALQLQRRLARSWTVTRERARLDSAFVVCNGLAQQRGGWQDSPAWLWLERARLHYLAGALDSVRATAEEVCRRGRADDRATTSLALTLIGVCDVRELDFERAERQFQAALALAAQEPELHDLVAWMSVPWDLLTREQRMEFDRCADRIAFLESYWAPDDPVLATPRLLEHRTEFRRRVAEAYLTLNGVDPAVPGPLSAPGRAILRFGWPRTWSSSGGQVKVAAESNPYILVGVDRTWMMAYRLFGPVGARPATLVFQDGGSGARFTPTDSLESGRYPRFSFDHDFGGLAYPFHAVAARFRDPDGRSSLVAGFDTYVPDYTLRHPLSGLRFAGTLDVRGCLYAESPAERTLLHEFALPLELETIPDARPLWARRSATTRVAGSREPGTTIAAELLMRDPTGRLLAIGVENSLPLSPAAPPNDTLALSDLLPIDPLPEPLRAESLLQLGPSAQAYGTHAREQGLATRACPLFLPEESFTFYLEAYDLARRDGRTLAELVVAIERLDPFGEQEYSIEISGRDQVLDLKGVTEWHIVHSIGLGNLAPGPYRVRATVIDHQADARREAVAQFQIVDPEEMIDFYGWRERELPARLLSPASAANESPPRDPS